MNNSEQPPQIDRNQGKRISIILTDEAMEMLDAFVSERMISKSQIIEMILRNYIPIHKEIVQGSTLQITRPDGTIEEVALNYI
ncbi:MAG: hypothetical protein F6K40_38790 [Okeania sp. SIO3I5]|uniref:hypothetical protein n=1 Tax=Okeania sp. SIO3I5 TaxID=2607805 RepID=UPI0013BADF5C|nr:hypothetical protein [Okeania sp. SIO3I5]NEQ41811.1 hypothetical protein [Okeania sp. SIO3I5]